ncbi:hypothetical protein AB0O01_25545 [Streptomyces sp. NPDC093252]|uniref:hypothetical protein n=1 Tax=Streptomyces sp. NPDC093252 TaxID=3154980 RepID=UPI0034283CAF
MIRRRRTAWTGATAALGTALVLLAPHPAHSAGTSLPTEGGYGFAEDARTVEPTGSTTGAERLEAGVPYRSTLPSEGKIYFRLELDAESTTYVAATAVPPDDAEVASADGIRVTVEDTDGGSCSYDTETIGAIRGPHPIVAWGVREAGPGSHRCKGAGTYYVVVERVATASSAPDAWDLELAAVTEPELSEPGATRAPESWNSATPKAVTGDPVRRPGGPGFASAARLGEGVWEDRIVPGQTLFYEVPLDWGTQLSATAELSGSAEQGSYTSGALDLTLHNPVRAPVEDAGAGYSGRQASAALQPLPPVGYDNRHATAGRVNGMRFAGSYYLVVHLSEQVAERLSAGPFGLTLRVGVDGAARPGPAYQGEPVPADVFTAEDASDGSDDDAGGDDLAGPVAGGVSGGSGNSGDSGTMAALAAGGIGAGTVLLAWLAVWSLLGHRRGAGTRRTGTPGTGRRGAGARGGSGRRTAV